MFFSHAARLSEIYTLSLHDALPISVLNWVRPRDLSHYERFEHYHATFYRHVEALSVDRKSTRLNSSHQIISYAVFCLKKKNRSTPDAATTAPRTVRQTSCTS